MPDQAATVASIVTAPSWDTRVSLLRRIPEEYGTSQHPAIYAAIAKQFYVPKLAPDFAYVSWREEYGLSSIQAAYDKAYSLTGGFVDVSVDHLTDVIQQSPTTLRIFRLLLGLLSQEFAAATLLVGTSQGLPTATNSRIKGIEAGSRPDLQLARCCAEVIDRTMNGALFPAAAVGLSPKIDKPDTLEGWRTVREMAQNGVPFAVFLHQRAYGGAFRQLLDATSKKRGDILEDAVQDLFNANGVLYLRTGISSQKEIETRFGLTVRPAPDFVVFSSNNTLQAILECKAANDGGTARDKAARFRALRQEGARLGGVPLFAVLGGLGWTRTSDALGPVIRDTDGRVFSIANLAEMLTTQPFPGIVQH